MKFIKEQRNELVGESKVPPKSNRIRNGIVSASVIGMGIAGTSMSIQSPPKISPPPASPIPITRQITVQRPKIPLKIKSVPRTKPLTIEKPKIVTQNVVTSPPIVSSITSPIKEIFIDKSEIDKKLITKQIKDGSVTFEDHHLRIKGRKHVVGPISIPFNILAHFVRNNSAIGLQIDQLSISGQIAGQSKRDEVQRQLSSMIKLDSHVKNVNLIVIQNKKVIKYWQFR